MLHRRTTVLAKCALLLNKLRNEPQNLTLLLGLQEFLLARIRGVERAILRFKVIRDAAKQRRKHGRLSREQSNLMKERIRSVEARIKDCQHLLFLWRCFGDGIANIYQSKYSLKHLFFSVKDYSIKERPGFITGKAGFEREWNVLKHGISAGVPVLLCDLTNILRYGDVCALAGTDPLPLEVKSSANSNARVDRQIEQLNALKEFFANDGAEEFRGIPDVRRYAIRLPEVNHVDAMNSCIERARSKGVASADPEPGLRYIAVRFDAIETDQLIEPSHTAVTCLSPTPDWETSYPFTLSLTPANLLSFIQSHVFVYVAIDLAVLKALFVQHGIHATMLMDGASAIQICPDPSDLSKGVFRISERLFQRIPLEFQSLEWFAAEHSLSFDANAPLVMNDADVASLKGLGSISDDWLNAKDFFDRESNLDELQTQPKQD